MFQVVMGPLIKTFQKHYKKFHSEIVAMALFTQFIHAARIFLAKKNNLRQHFPQRSSCWKRAKKQRYHDIQIHFYLIPFFQDAFILSHELSFRLFKKFDIETIAIALFI